jgi:hypothetical protein
MLTTKEHWQKASNDRVPNSLMRGCRAGLVPQSAALVRREGSRAGMPAPLFGTKCYAWGGDMIATLELVLYWLVSSVTAAFIGLAVTVCLSELTGR